MRTVLSSVGAVFLAGFLAVSLPGPANSAGAGERELRAATSQRAHHGPPSVLERELKPGHVPRHDSPPAASLTGSGPRLDTRFTDVVPPQSAGTAQRRPSSVAFSLYPTGPPPRL